MNDHATAPHRRGYAGAIEQIATGNLDAIAEEALRFLRRAAEHAYRCAPVQQPVRDVSANEAGATRDQELRRHAHSCRIYVKRERQRSVFHRR